MELHLNGRFIGRNESVFTNRILGLRCVLMATLSLLSLAACRESDETIVSPVSASRQSFTGDSQTILFEETRETSKGIFTFVAEMDEKGEPRLVAYGEDGREVAWEEAIDIGISSVIGEGLLSLLEEGASGKVVVNISLRDDIEPTEIEAEWGMIDDEGGRIWINGKEATETDVEASNQRLQASLQRDREARVEKRERILGELVAGENWDLPDGLIKQVAGSSDPLRLELDLDDIQRIAEEHSALIGAIDLYQEPEDASLATAMAATWVSPGAHGLGHLGSGIGIYMTETGCPPAGYMPSYTRLAGGDTEHSRSVSSITRAVAPGTYLYCRSGGVLPSVSDLSDPGPGGKPAIRVINSSSGTTSSSEYSLVDRDWDNFIYSNGVPVIQAAGNSGETTGNVSSPGKGLNIVTVGNYDDQNGNVVAGSSWLNPTNTKNFKPEFVAPGQRIDAGTTSAGGSIVGSGTSAAAPHVAGIAALLMESSPVRQGRPHLVAANLIRGARDPVGGGVDRVGLGGIDYYHVRQRGWSYYYQGNNSAFSSWDLSDPLPGNGSVDRYATLSPDMGWVRIVLAYLTRGTWTYDHRNDTFPIGRGLTFSVYRPDGSLVAGAFNLYAGVESVQFRPSVSGTYLIRIFEHWNNDTSAKLHMAITMSYGD